MAKKIETDGTGLPSVGEIPKMPPVKPPKEEERVLEWLCCGDVGVSSKAIVFVMCGVSPDKILENSWTPYPHDSSDFSRCYNLLKIFPGWRKRIKEMNCLGKIWGKISSAWDELEVLYVQKNHEELYERLQQLQPAE